MYRDMMEKLNKENKMLKEEVEKMKQMTEKLKGQYKSLKNEISVKKNNKTKTSSTTSTSDTAVQTEFPEIKIVEEAKEKSLVDEQEILLAKTEHHNREVGANYKEIPKVPCVFVHYFEGKCHKIISEPRVLRELSPDRGGAGGSGGY